MLMQERTGVNASPPPRAVMLSIAGLAARDGVSKAAVSRKVKQLANDHALTVERDGQGRVAGVNVAEYDHLRGRYDDPSKAQAPNKPSRTGMLPLATSATPPVQPDETYDEALRQKTWIEAERARIKLATEMGQLVAAEAVESALSACGEDVGRVLERLSGQSDEMAAAVMRDGVHGIRVLLKQIVFKMKNEVADALERAASVHAQANDGEGTSAAPEMVQ